MEDQTSHVGLPWGKWLSERATFLGMRSRESMADAIGISTQHLRRLLKREVPPRRIQRRIEKILSKVLEAPRDIIFSGYRNIDPEQVKVSPSVDWRSGTRIIAMDLATGASRSIVINGVSVDEAIERFEKIAGGGQ